MSIQFVQISCARQGCHTIFGIPQPVVDRLQETHESFYCPFGHSQSYPGETPERELEKTKKLLATSRKEREQLQAERDTARKDRDQFLAEWEAAQKKLRSQKLASKKAIKK